MKLMRKTKWANMSDEAKVQHLLAHDFEYRTQPLVNVASTGDEDTIGWRYQSVVGGVAMSSWHGSKQLAAEEALENTANFVAGINHLSN